MNGNDVELNGVGLETDRTVSEPAQAIPEARAQETIPCETASAPVSAHAAEAVKSDAPAPKAAPAQREAPKKAQPQKPAAKSHNSSKNAKGKEKKQDSLLADLASLLLRIGWIAFVIAVLLLVVCGVTVNSGNRMYPAFHDRDIVFYYRLAKDIKAAEDPEEERKNKIAEYENTMMNPYVAASRGYVDDVIVPSETRQKLIKAFKALEGKVQEAPFKKHGNIPL